MGRLGSASYCLWLYMERLMAFLGNFEADHDRAGHA